MGRGEDTDYPKIARILGALVTLCDFLYCIREGRKVRFCKPDLNHIFPNIFLLLQVLENGKGRRKVLPVQRDPSSIWLVGFT